MFFFLIFVWFVVYVFICFVVCYGIFYCLCVEECLFGVVVLVKISEIYEVDILYVVLCVYVC